MELYIWNPMSAPIWFLLLIQRPDTPHRALSSSVVRLQLSSGGLLIRLMFGSNESPTGCLPNSVVVFPHFFFHEIIHFSRSLIRRRFLILSDASFGSFQQFFSYGVGILAPTSISPFLRLGNGWESAAGTWEEILFRF